MCDKIKFSGIWWNIYKLDHGCERACIDILRRLLVGTLKVGKTECKYNDWWP